MGSASRSSSGLGASYIARWRFCTFLHVLRTFFGQEICTILVVRSCCVCGHDWLIKILKAFCGSSFLVSLKCVHIICNYMGYYVFFFGFSPANSKDGGPWGSCDVVT